MWLGKILTDFNGLVLFDPLVMKQHYGDTLTEGRDLFTEYITTDEGDAVLAAGLIVPVLAIDAAGYDVVVRLSTEASPLQAELVAENGVFPLRVLSRLVIADLAVLKYWMEEEGWEDVPISAGTYGVTIRAFRALDAARENILQAGYEFVLNPEPALPPVTGDTGKHMRVLEW
jgi:hypothetical protein